MKKTVLVICIICVGLLITGCSNDAQVKQCYESVQAKYSDGDIVRIPGRNYSFIVKLKNGDILYIETLSLSNSSITQEFTAFRGDRSNK